MTKKIVTIIMIISLFSTFTSLSVFAEKNSYVNLTEGKTVYMAGATSTLKSGKIVSSSMIADGSDDDGVTIKDCVEASYLSDPGDSGGLVYLKQNNQQYIAGINVAECYENKKEVGSIFVKAKNVVDVLNIIPY